MAVSPGFVFYGRYSIHEVWMQFFSMLAIFGGLGLWKFGTRKYLWFTGMALTGMILTKETYIIHVSCALIAIAVVWFSQFLGRISGKAQRIIILLLVISLLIMFFVVPWMVVWNRQVAALEAAGFVLHGNYAWLMPVAALAAIVWSLVKENRLFGALLGLGWLTITAIILSTMSMIGESRVLFGGHITLLLSACLLAVALIPANTELNDDEPLARQSWDKADLLTVIGVGVALIVFFYSGTFFHWAGLKGLYQAYAPWFSTGTEGHGHEKPWYVLADDHGTIVALVAHGLPGLRVAGTGRAGFVRVRSLLQKSQSALSGGLRRGHVRRLQLRRLQNAVVHH